MNDNVPQTNDLVRVKRISHKADASSLDTESEKLQLEFARAGCKIEGVHLTIIVPSESLLASWGTGYLRGSTTTPQESRLIKSRNEIEHVSGSHQFAKERWKSAIANGEWTHQPTINPRNSIARKEASERAKQPHQQKLASRNDSTKVAFFLCSIAIGAFTGPLANKALISIGFLEEFDSTIYSYIAISICFTAIFITQAFTHKRSSNKKEIISGESRTLSALLPALMLSTGWLLGSALEQSVPSPLEKIIIITLSFALICALLYGQIILLPRLRLRDTQTPTALILGTFGLLFLTLCINAPSAIFLWINGAPELVGSIPIGTLISSSWIFLTLTILAASSIYVTFKKAVRQGWTSTMLVMIFLVTLVILPVSLLIPSIRAFQYTSQLTQNDQRNVDSPPFGMSLVKPHCSDLSNTTDMSTEEHWRKYIYLGQTSGVQYFMFAEKTDLQILRLVEPDTLPCIKIDAPRFSSKITVSSKTLTVEKLSRQSESR